MLLPIGKLEEVDPSLSEDIKISEIMFSTYESLIKTFSLKQPTLWVVVIAIPLGLVFSYTSNEQNREYWFSIPGLVSLGIIGALYAAALFVVRKQIQRVKDS